MATTTLVRGLRHVVVGHATVLSPDELLGILREAGVGYVEFLELVCDAPEDSAAGRGGRGAARVAPRR